MTVVIEETKTTDLDVPLLAGAQFAEALNSYSERNGVTVENVAEGSPAARLGLRTGDVILAVNRKTVRTIAELRESLRSAGGAFVFRVQRGDAQVFIAAQR